MRRSFLLGLGWIAAQLAAQDPAADVEKACTSAKLGLRLAAARKVAGAGDAAVPAIRAFETERGRAAIAQTLVEAIASGEVSTEKTVLLLLDWARDRDFYWRAQALGGLAARKLESVRGLFLQALQDPAHLYRVQGARGLLALGVSSDRAKVLPLLRDDDPRARVQIAILLLDLGERAGVPVLIEALRGSEREFLGDPWGRREALLAAKALERAADKSFGWSAEQNAQQNAAAIAALEGFFGARAPAPRDSRPAPATFSGGVEIRSCKHGDLFLRFTADGSFAFGLDGEDAWKPPAELQDEIAAARKRITGEAAATFGVVICDFVRFWQREPALHWKCAERHVPPAVAEWLKTLATALEKTERRASAETLSARLRQFAPDDQKEKK